MKKERDSLLDVLKGVLIYLVVLGHVIQYFGVVQNFFDNTLFKFIYSFHMPLFAMISGYLLYYSLSHHSYKSVLFSRVKTLCIPIIVWGTIINIYGMILCTWFDIGRYTDIWFLWTILFATIFVVIYSKMPKFRFGLLILGFLIVNFLPNGKMNLFLYPYFVLGYLYNENKTKINTSLVDIVKKISLVGYPLLMLLFNKQAYIYVSGTVFNAKERFLEHLLIDVYRFLVGFLGSVFIIVIAKAILKTFSKFKGFENAEKCIANVGKLSLQIYVLQIVVVERFIPDFLNFFDLDLGKIFNEFVFTYLIGPIISLVIVFCICIGVKFISRFKKISFVLFGR